MTAAPATNPARMPPPSSKSAIMGYILVSKHGVNRREKGV